MTYDDNLCPDCLARGIVSQAGFLVRETSRCPQCRRSGGSCVCNGRVSDEDALREIRELPEVMR